MYQLRVVRKLGERWLDQTLPYTRSLHDFPFLAEALSRKVEAHGMKVQLLRNNQVIKSITYE